LYTLGIVQVRQQLIQFVYALPPYPLSVSVSLSPL
jgi:hypothetical protein